MLSRQSASSFCRAFCQTMYLTKSPILVATKLKRFPRTIVETNVQWAAVEVFPVCVYSSETNRGDVSQGSGHHDYCRQLLILASEEQLEVVEKKRKEESPSSTTVLLFSCWILVSFCDGSSVTSDGEPLCHDLLNLVGFPFSFSFLIFFAT